MVKKFNILYNKLYIKVDGIYLASCHLRKTTVYCPTCCKKTTSIHSVYHSKFYDLLVQEIPVLIELERKNTFVENAI